MNTAIHIIDYNQNKKLFLILLEEDMQNLDEVWNKRSGFSKDLRKKTKIEKTKYSDLSYREWKKFVFSLIAEFLALMPEIEISDDNELIQLIQLGFVGLVKRYGLDFGGSLDHIKIQKVSEGIFDLSTTAYDTIEYIGDSDAA